jgi:hypothetical protein
VGTIPSAFVADAATYLLANSVILDSGATIHVFNKRSRFVTFTPAKLGDVLWAGDTQIPIQGYGDVEIRVNSPYGPRQIRLLDAAFCKGIHCNLASLKELRKRGFYWDNKPQDTLLKRYVDDSVVCSLQEQGGQFVLEHNQYDVVRQSAFPTSIGRKNKINSWTKRADRTSYAVALRWHNRLGHPGPQVLERLVNRTTGVRIRGITTVDCDFCAQAKMKRHNVRGPRELPDKPGKRFAIDFHDFEADEEGFRSLVLITDRYAGLMWDYYVEDRTAETIRKVISDFVDSLERGGKIPQTIEMDNEVFEKRAKVMGYLASKRIRCEPSAAYTQSQNGAAERSGGVVKAKINAMRQEVKFPTSLWREITRTAIYLLNRTPRWQYDWQTPYERYHSVYPQQSRKPNLSHLREFGCKAFVMTANAHKKVNRLKRFEPKAWLGYLIGYEASSIYRIWNPLTNVVVRARDVDFDESQKFHGDMRGLQDEVKNLSLRELSETKPLAP